MQKKIKQQNVCRAIVGGMIGLVAVAGGLAAEAATIGYWRMGDDTSLLTDSSGNGLTLTNNGSVSSVAIPASGDGSDFSNPITRTGATNTSMAQFSGGNQLTRTNPFDNLVDFTAEAYINSGVVSTGTQYVMGQWASSTGNRSWALGKAASGGTGGAGGNEMFLILSSDGSTSTIVPLGLTLALDKDYYVAFSFDGGSLSNDITFYYQNLTDGGALTSSVITSGVTKVYNVLGTDANQDFRIGYAGSYWTGLIDEVRVSDTVLSQSQLLIIPEPASGLLLLLGGGLCLQRRRRHI